MCRQGRACVAHIHVRGRGDCYYIITTSLLLLVLLLLLWFVFFFVTVLLCGGGEDRYARVEAGAT